MLELKAQIKRAQVDSEQQILQANTDKDVLKVKAEEDASVMLTKAKGDQKIVVNEVKAETVTHINKARTDAQKQLIDTEKKVKVMQIEATTNNEKNKSKYQAWIQECEAELSNLDAINAQREHQFQLNKASAYEALGAGRNTKIVMSGSSGEALISKIFDLE